MLLLCAAVCLFFSTAYDGSLRLVGGSGPHEGRVEIFYNEQWGTVCSDGWDIRDATVVCQQLGYLQVAALFVASVPFGVGNGPIWLDEVACSGTEASLTQCNSSAIGETDCSHYEDVGVSCLAEGRLNGWWTLQTRIRTCTYNIETVMSIHSCCLYLIACFVLNGTSSRGR